MLDVKPFKQTPGFCGPACLKIVFSYYGLEKSVKELAKLSNCSKEKGTSARGLVDAANNLGFNAEIKDNCSFQDIEKYLHKKTPVIVDWFLNDEGHYSVAVGTDKENIYLQDPHLGHIRAMKLETFYRVWFDFPESFLRTKDDLILRRIIAIEK